MDRRTFGKILAAGISGSIIPSIGNTAQAPKSANDLGRYVMGFDAQSRASIVDALSPVVAGAEIVLLGEPSHGDGGAIQLRSKLVESLADDFGFDVLIFEADFFSIPLGWANVGIGSDLQTFAEANIYDFWSRAPAARPLWEFVDKRKRAGQRIDLAGVDCRLRGAIAKERLIEFLGGALASTGLHARPQFATFVVGIRKLFDEENSFKPDNEFEATWFAFARAAVDTLQSSKPTQNSFASATLASLMRWAGSAWRGESRDRAMGLNLAWLRDHKFPGRKIIVWAHNNHILKDARVLTTSLDPKLFSDETADEKAQYIYLGQVATQLWGPKVRSIAVIDGMGLVSADFPRALSGARMNFEPTQRVPKHSQVSLESMLLSSDNINSIVHLHKHPDKFMQFRCSALDLYFEAMAPYSLGYDALIFNKETHGLMV